MQAMRHDSLGSCSVSYMASKHGKRFRPKSHIMLEGWELGDPKYYGILRRHHPCDAPNAEQGDTQLEHGHAKSAIPVIYVKEGHGGILRDIHPATDRSPGYLVKEI